MDFNGWKNSSSDSDDSEHSDEAFMANSGEEHGDEKTTLSYFKQNLNIFSTNKLIKLVVVFTWFDEWANNWKWSREQ